jgi:hypothetical protein
MLTAAFDINDRAQVVGQYLDAAGRMHGFLWERGRFTTIDTPGVPLTTAQGLNDRGQIVGYSANDFDLTGARGFLLAKGVNDRLTRSASRARPGRSPTASTTAARSSASTRTPTPRRARNASTGHRHAGWPLLRLRPACSRSLPPAH